MIKWSEIFKLNKKCTHQHISPQEDIAYCPDCGELVENHWYITRCACCGMKLPASIHNSQVVPESKFCHNCGANSFITERIEKIDCININYAVLLKETVDTQVNEYTQSWAEAMQTLNYIPKQLQQYQ